MVSEVIDSKALEIGPKVSRVNPYAILNQLLGADLRGGGILSAASILERFSNYCEGHKCTEDPR